VRERGGTKRPRCARSRAATHTSGVAIALDKHRSRGAGSRATAYCPPRRTVRGGGGRRALRPRSRTRRRAGHADAARRHRALSDWALRPGEALLVHPAARTPSSDCGRPRGGCPKPSFRDTAAVTGQGGGFSEAGGGTISSVLKEIHLWAPKGAAKGPHRHAGSSDSGYWARASAAVVVVRSPPHVNARAGHCDLAEAVGLEESA